MHSMVSCDSPQADWVAHEDPEHGTYYENQTTGETSWEKPEGFVDAAAGGAEEWVEQQDAEGQTYYYNNVCHSARQSAADRTTRTHPTRQSSSFSPPLFNLILRCSAARLACFPLTEGAVVRCVSVSSR